MCKFAQGGINYLFFLLHIDTSKGVCNDNIAKYPFDPWTTSLKNPMNSFFAV